jgi:hypothetical protein
MNCSSPDQGASGNLSVISWDSLLVRSEIRSDVSSVQSIQDQLRFRGWQEAWLTGRGHAAIRRKQDSVASSPLLFSAIVSKSGLDFIVLVIVESCSPVTSFMQCSILHITSRRLSLVSIQIWYLVESLLASRTAVDSVYSNKVLSAVTMLAGSSD